MAINESGQIKLSDLFTEFDEGTHDGSQEIQLSDFFDHGNAPASGPAEIQLATDFYGTSDVFVDPYTGTRLRSQGTGARYSIWGGGYISAGSWWTGMSAAGYVDTIAQKNPFTDATASHTGDMDWGKASCGVASNGTTMISSGGFNDPFESGVLNQWGWSGSMGAYVAPTIENLNSSSGGNAGTHGDVHYFELGYPGQSNDTRKFYFGSNCVGEDGATGYYAGGSGRHSPGRASTDEIWKTAISSASDSVDWGADLSSAVSTGMHGASGYTGTQGTLDTRWIMMGASSNSDDTKYYTFASASSGSAHGDLIETEGYNMSGRRNAVGSNGTRAVIMGGSNTVDSSPAWQGYIGNTIQYLTVASTSHAQMFGDTSMISDGYNSRSCNGQYLEAHTANLYQDRPNDDTMLSTPRVATCDRVSLASTGNASANGNHLGYVYSEMDTVHNGGTGSN